MKISFFVKFRNRWKPFPNSTWLYLILLFLLTLSFRVYYRYYHRIFVNDTMVLMGCAQRYPENDAFVHLYGIADKLPHTQTRLLEVFPTGYPMLLHWVDTLIHDKLTTVYLIDIVALSLFLGCVFILIYLIKPSPPPYLWITISAYFSLTPTFLHPLPATDLLALSLLSLSITCVMIYLHTRRLPILWSILGGIALVLTSTVRYAYIPFLFALPISLGFAIGKKQPAHTHIFFLSYSLLPLLMGGFHLLDWMLAERVPYLNTLERGFFPEHLLHMHPFPLVAIQYISISQIQSIANFLALPSLMINTLLWMGAWFVLAGIGYSWYKCATDKKYTSVSFNRVFTYLSLGIFCSNWAMLIYLSLTKPPETGWTDFWTYLMEIRYYAPIHLVLFISLIGILIQLPQIRLRKWIFATIGLIWLISASALTYVRIQQLRGYHPYTYPAMEYDLMLHYAQQFVNTSKIPVFYYCYKGPILDLTDAIEVRTPSSVDTLNFQSSEPVHLLLVFPPIDKQSNAEQAFLKHTQPKLILDQGNWIMYQTTFHPQKKDWPSSD